VCVPSDGRNSQINQSNPMRQYPCVFYLASALNTVHGMNDILSADNQKEEALLDIYELLRNHLLYLSAVLLSGGKVLSKDVVLV